MNPFFFRLEILLFCTLFLGLPIVSFGESARSDQSSEHNIHPIEKLPESQRKQIKTKYSKFEIVEWLDLMPKKDLNALLNPPSYIENIQEGIVEDEILNELKNLPKSLTDPYQKALVSTDVKKEMNGKAIKIPGFIVPLDFSSEKEIKNFFLVPYFGACIHVPPPPPNQIIYVSSEKPFQLKNLYDPYWISGTLKTTSVTNDLAIAAYSMAMKTMEIYEEE